MVIEDRESHDLTSCLVSLGDCDVTAVSRGVTVETMTVCGGLSWYEWSHGGFLVVSWGVLVVFWWSPEVSWWSNVVLGEIQDGG